MTERCRRSEGNADPKVCERRVLDLDDGGTSTLPKCEVCGRTIVFFVPTVPRARH